MAGDVSRQKSVVPPQPACFCKIVATTFFTRLFEDNFFCNIYGDKSFIKFFDDKTFLKSLLATKLFSNLFWRQIFHQVL